MQYPTKNLCPAVEIIHVVSIDPICKQWLAKELRIEWYGSIPVENVEKSVESKYSNIMWGYVLDESDFIEHDNLWDKGHCFKPQAETPHKFPRGPPTVDY